MTVYAYLRVSTERQSKEGLSIEIQEQQIEGYAKSKGESVNVWIRDRGVSGSVPLSQRDQGKRLLEDLKEGDTIICSKLDRMFRSARDALNVLDDFKKKGVELHIIDLGGSVTNGIGQLVFTILSAVAEQERSRIRERISEAKEKLRKEGRYQGGKIPFGYELTDDGVLVDNPLEKQAIKVMRSKRKSGLSYRQISELLNEEHGVSISHNAIRKILSGERKTTVSFI